MQHMRTTLIVLALACVGFFAVSAAATAAEPELRPSQKLMQARAAWVKAMGENLAAQIFDAVKADAEALSAQAGTVAQKLDNPLAKELTLRVSTLAAGAAKAAAAKDQAAVTAALADVKATCGECHAKIRDKK